MVQNVALSPVPLSKRRQRALDRRLLATQLQPDTVHPEQRTGRWVQLPAALRSFGIGAASGVGEGKLGAVAPRRPLGAQRNSYTGILIHPQDDETYLAHRSMRRSGGVSGREQQ